MGGSGGRGPAHIPAARYTDQDLPLPWAAKGAPQRRLCWRAAETDGVAGAGGPPGGEGPCRHAGEGARAAWPSLLQSGLLAPSDIKRESSCQPTESHRASLAHHSLLHHRRYAQVAPQQKMPARKERGKMYRGGPHLLPLSLLAEPCAQPEWHRVAQGVPGLGCQWPFATPPLTRQRWRWGSSWGSCSIQAVSTFCRTWVRIPLSPHSHQVACP